jgi:hypothetical protein
MSSSATATATNKPFVNVLATGGRLFINHINSVSDTDIFNLILKCIIIIIIIIIIIRCLVVHIV